jgi:hypothetical protein
MFFFIFFLLTNKWLIIIIGKIQPIGLAGLYVSFSFVISYKSAKVQNKTFGQLKKLCNTKMSCGRYFTSLQLISASPRA